MQLTPYPDINSFFDTLLLQLKAILGERLIGVYLFGSLVWGDFEYGSSDIDLLVVTSSTITKNEFDKLHGRPGQAYGVLTMCRAYYTYKNGEQASKKRATTWTAKAFPQWAALIENALMWRENWRINQVDDEETLPETKRFVHFILDQINN